MFAQEMKFRFSLVKNERVFEFLITPGTPWADVQEVLKDFAADFVELEKQIAEQMAKQQAAQQPVKEGE